MSESFYWYVFPSFTSIGLSDFNQIKIEIARNEAAEALRQVAERNCDEPYT